MKTYAKLLGAVMLVLTLASSCRKDFNYRPAESVFHPFTGDAKWVVMEYVENRTDYTFLFKRVELVFSPNGLVTAYKDGLSVRGKWKYSSTNDRPVMRIDFGAAPDPYSRLTETWDIASQNDAGFTLKAIGLNHQTKYLSLRRL